jgi:NADPH:quinone reductase-like Zn-dependent oxidoreductase
MKVIEVNGGGLDKLQVVDRADPSPGAGEVLVRWHATSLNFHDYLVALGAIPVPENRIPMSDGAGEVVALGDGVLDWKVGDKVMSLFFPNWMDGNPNFQKIAGVSGETVDGYITELSTISAKSLTRIPEGYSYAEAATLPCAGLTAWNGLTHTGGLMAGQKVLIEGTGGMSLLGLQLAKAAGAKVYATTSSAEKAERLMSMGVESVVNYKEDERWGKSIFKQSGGGVDIVLDVGGGSTMQQSIEASKMGGTVISIGILGDGRKGSITFPKLFFKFINLKGIAVGSKLMQEAMVDAIETGNVKPDIDKSFAFDQLKEAFAYQASGKQFGKIVLEY